MESPDRSPLRVVAALIRRGDTVLVQQRAAHKTRGGLWEFPGGKVEAGESDEDALARELREELGVEAEIGERLDGVVHAYDDLTVEVLLYRADIAADVEPQAHDAAQVAWVLTRELGALEFVDADGPIVARVARSNP